MNQISQSTGVEKIENSEKSQLKKVKELTLDEKEVLLAKLGWTHSYAGYDNPNSTAHTTTGADASD